MRYARQKCEITLLGGNGTDTLSGEAGPSDFGDGGPGIFDVCTASTETRISC